MRTLSVEEIREEVRREVERQFREVVRGGGDLLAAIRNERARLAAGDELVQTRVEGLLSTR